MVRLWSGSVYVFIMCSVCACVCVMSKTSCAIYKKIKHNFRKCLSCLGCERQALLLNVLFVHLEQRKQQPRVNEKHCYLA